MSVGDRSNVAAIVKPSEGQIELTVPVPRPKVILMTPD